MTSQELAKVRRRAWMLRNPWYKHLDNARSRTRHPSARMFPWYGGRGIKCFLTVPEVHSLWVRDNAGAMVVPSLDRLDSDGHYTVDNCRFIEFSENVALGNRSRSSKNREGLRRLFGVEKKVA